MGLLDRWTKKKNQEQLDKGAEVQVAPKKEKKIAVKEVEKPAAAAADALAKPEAKSGVLADKILIKALVTEKAAVSQSLNKYSFLVSRDANKHQIKQAVKEKYGVKPIEVNVMNIQGKPKRFGRATGRRSDYRKAIITLVKGQSITIHEGV